jgi:hypothetical protein
VNGSDSAQWPTINAGHWTRPIQPSDPDRDCPVCGIKRPQSEARTRRAVDDILGEGTNGKPIEPEGPATDDGLATV